jgi:hypothetical protein
MKKAEDYFFAGFVFGVLLMVVVKIILDTI